MDQIKEYIKSLGYDFSPDRLDSSFQEWSDQKSKGWYIGKELGSGKYVFTFGDWRTGEKYSTQIGLDDSQNFTEELRALKEKTKQERYERHEAGAERARQYLKRLETDLVCALPSGYLLKKGGPAQVVGTFTAYNSWSGVDLIIPMYSFDEPRCGGNLWNFQRIQADGFKQFSEGARVSGCFHIIGREGIYTDTPTQEVYISEGYATGLTIYESLKRQKRENFCVVVAFNASNLPKVALEFYKKLKTRKTGALYICADNDIHTEKKTKTNPGLLAARKALDLCEGFAKILVPNIKPTDPGSDWNDFEHLYGKDLLDQEILNQLEATENPKLPEVTKPKTQTLGLPEYLKPYVNGLAPLGTKIGTDGKTKPPEELEVAHYVLQYLESHGSVEAFEGNLFIYDGRVWNEASEDRINEIKKQILVALGGKANNKKLDSVFGILMKLLKPMPQNPYQHRENKINVANGTIHLEKTEDSWSVEFKPHSPDDYLTIIIPYNYDPGSGLPKMFEAMLENIFRDDDEKLEKIRLIQEMYGSCLAPIFPRLFLLWGKGGSGKTSLILPALRLVDMKNASSVEPSQMDGFILESMAGKLVNYVADIDINEPIKDSIVKRIEDRVPVLVNRKFKKATLASLPLVHIFAGNAIPPTLERGSGAYLRRWSFIHCKSMDRSKDPTFNYANDAFDENPSGILNWALEGLLRLLNSKGKFTTHESERRKIESWQLEHDFIYQFLLDLGQGEVPGLRYSPEGKVKRSLIWEIFVEWYKVCYGRNPRIGRNKFLSALEEKCPELRTEKCPGPGIEGANYLRCMKSDGIYVLCGVELTRGDVVPF